MRVSPLLASLSLFSAPAIAQSAPPGAPLVHEPIQLPPELADPATADKLAGAAEQLSRALLDMKVGGIQSALEGRRPTPAERNLTVRDLARRDDPNIDRHIQQQIAQAKPRLEQAIRALNEALPEVTQDLDSAHKALERAIANMPDPNYPNR
jgi:hypothetical protein